MDRLFFRKSCRSIVNIEIFSFLVILLLFQNKLLNFALDQKITIFYNYFLVIFNIILQTSNIEILGLSNSFLTLSIPGNFYKIDVNIKLFNEAILLVIGNVKKLNKILIKKNEIIIKKKFPFFFRDNNTAYLTEIVHGLKSLKLLVHQHHPK